MADIRILIADDHAILRDGLRSLLDRQEGMVVVGEATNGREAFHRTDELLPDIVLMDVSMPVMDGLQATRQIKSKYPDMKILILTQHDSPEYIRPLLEAGAAGYVLKRSGGREVVAAIRNVWEQGAFLQPDVARQFLKDYSHTGDQPPTEEIHFTEREQEILKLAVEGKSNKEIATLLCISPKTVSVHRSNIMSKLGVRSGVELVRYAMQHKLVKVGPHKLDNTN